MSIVNDFGTNVCLFQCLWFFKTGMKKEAQVLAETFAIIQNPRKDFWFSLKRPKPFCGILKDWYSIGCRSGGWTYIRSRWKNLSVAITPKVSAASSRTILFIKRSNIKETHKHHLNLAVDSIKKKRKRQCTYYARSKDWYGSEFSSSEKKNPRRHTFPRVLLYF